MYGFYDYYEEVKKDVLKYIEEEVDLEVTDFDELKTRLYDDLMNEDSVTGNASGSYTSDQCKAQKYVEDNKDLVREMSSEFCIEQKTMQRWLDDDYKGIDVCIRCYVLGSAIASAIEELREAAE